ncbi:MAG: Lrp/AsnC ligand binding domain-containing protein [Deltaproteobacteria bacterium]|nr:Lrp/AsnC ligand binding domain-containing protein [Deltaproteobacteria bacterium]
MLTALILINVEKGKIHNVAEEISQLEEVVEVYSIAGPYDLMAKVQVNEYEAFNEIIPDKLQKIDGIKSTQTLMAFKAYKF